MNDKKTIELDEETIYHYANNTLYGSAGMHAKQPEERAYDAIMLACRAVLDKDKQYNVQIQELAPDGVEVLNYMEFPLTRAQVESRARNSMHHINTIGRLFNETCRGLIDGESND